MEKLASPTDTPLKVFRACISRVEDIALKTRLESIEPDIVATARSYKERARRATLYRLPSHPDVRGIVSKKEMSDVYNNRMVKGPGRAFYERLINAPAHGRCPLCALRDVSTLDHYLSQKDYPILSVVPLNLVPACFPCNKRKGMKHAALGSEQPMHPYFDDIDRARWLKARVKEVYPGALEYYVEGPRSWSAGKLSRVRYHFEMFDLKNLYLSKAAQEIVGNQRQFTKLLVSNGPMGVRRHLREQEDTWSVHRNFWKTVMFRTLATSDWFCRGGFRR